MASSGVSFTFGSVTYIADLETFRAFAETWATETETARGGQVNLNARLDTFPGTGQAAAGNIAWGGYRLTGLGDPSGAQDAATRAYVDATLIGGGSPSNIPITSLNVGTATANQIITINGGGTAPVGVAKTSLSVLGWGYSGLSAGQFVRLNAAGNALEGATVTVTGPAKRSFYASF